MRTLIVWLLCVLPLSAADMNDLNKISREWLKDQIMGTYSGGNGEEATPYQIATVADWTELVATSGDWDTYLVLTADIDFGGAEIGFVGTSVASFTGQFDGDNFCLSNLTISDSDARNGTALFVRSSGVIKDLKITNAAVTGSNHETTTYSQYNAIVVAENAYGGSITGCTLTNCYVIGHQTATNLPAYTGMVAGANHGTVENCAVIGGSVLADIVVTGTPSNSNCYVGGVVAYQIGGTEAGKLGMTKGCTSSATVGSRLGTSTTHNILAYGGIVGCLAESGTDLVNYIENCHYTGTMNVTVATFADVGGVVGRTINEVDVYDCSAIANISCVFGTLGRVGGIAGILYGSSGDATTMDDCYADCNIRIDMGSSGAYVGGGVGQTTGASATGNAVINNCYSWGSIYDIQEASTTLNFWYGGFVGTANTSAITNCYAAIDTYAAKAGMSYVKGFAGHQASSTFTACYWDTESSGITASDGYDGTTGADTATMQTQATFTTASWDFDSADGRPWKSTATGMYPILDWETYGYGGGAGTIGNPYQLKTLVHWNYAYGNLDERTDPIYYRVKGDIDLSAQEMIVRNGGGGGWY